MQQEDDLQGLAKVLDFIRAISILFVEINIYCCKYKNDPQYFCRTFKCVEKKKKICLFSNESYLCK